MEMQVRASGIRFSSGASVLRPGSQETAGPGSGRGEELPVSEEGTGSRPWTCGRDGETAGELVRSRSSEGPDPAQVSRLLPAVDRVSMERG